MNDTAGNSVNTTIYSFEVANTPPSQATAIPTITIGTGAINNSNLTLHFRDVDNDLLNYTINNITGANFNISNSTGILMTFGNIISLENITVNVTDGINITTSSNFTINVVDGNFPTFGNASNLSIEFKRYQNFTANITFHDNGVLDAYIFSTNASGAWTNITVDISGEVYAASHQVNISFRRNVSVGWYYWVNDTVGNINNTEIYTFEVANTPPMQTSLVQNITVVVGSVNYTNLSFHFADADGDNINYSMVNVALVTFSMDNLTDVLATTGVQEGNVNTTVNVTDGVNVTGSSNISITVTPLPQPDNGGFSSSPNNEPAPVAAPAPPAQNPAEQQQPQQNEQNQPNQGDADVVSGERPVTGSYKQGRSCPPEFKLIGNSCIPYAEVPESEPVFVDDLEEHVEEVRPTIYMVKTAAILPDVPVLDEPNCVKPSLIPMQEVSAGLYKKAIGEITGSQKYVVLHELQGNNIKILALFKGVKGQVCLEYNLNKKSTNPLLKLLWITRGSSLITEQFCVSLNGETAAIPQEFQLCPDLGKIAAEGKITFKSNVEISEK